MEGPEHAKLTALGIFDDSGMTARGRLRRDGVAKKVENNPMHSRNFGWVAGDGNSMLILRNSLDPSGKQGVYCHHRKGWVEAVRPDLMALQVIV